MFETTRSILTMVYKQTYEWGGPPCNDEWRFPEIGVPPNHPFSMDFL